MSKNAQMTSINQNQSQQITIPPEQQRKQQMLDAMEQRKSVRYTLKEANGKTAIVQAGVDLPTVKRISGHKTLQMVERYAHQNNEHIQQALGKLDSRYRG